MAVSPFDRLSRLVAQSATRRTALILAAAWGGAAAPAAAGKKKNKCKGGCGLCAVCKKQGKKKKCVPAPSSATCASLGKTCGPVDDGCGATLECGTCGTDATPACSSGTCTACAAACSLTCSACYHRLDGSTVCRNLGIANCGLACMTDADCPPSTPLCAAAFTVRATESTTLFSSACGSSVAAICVAAGPC